MALQVSPFHLLYDLHAIFVCWFFGIVLLSDGLLAWVRCSAWFFVLFFFWSVWLRILDAMHAVSQYGHLSVRSYPISIGKNHMSFVWHVAKCCEKANLKSPRGVIFSGDGIVFV